MQTVVMKSTHAFQMWPFSLKYTKAKGKRQKRKRTRPRFLCILKGASAFKTGIHPSLLMHVVCTQVSVPESVPEYKTQEVSFGLLCQHAATYNEICQELYQSNFTQMVLQKQEKDLCLHGNS